MIPGDIFSAVLVVGTTIFFTWFLTSLIIELFFKKSSNNKQVSTKIATYFFVTASFVGYLYVSSPDGIAVDETGKIDWAPNKVRMWLQGERFWRNQLNEVEDRIQCGENALKKLPEIWAMHWEARRIEDADLEEFCRKHPDASPSDTARQASLLRAEADQLERLENQRFVLEIERQRLDVNMRIRKIIVQHLAGIGRH